MPVDQRLAALTGRVAARSRGTRAADLGRIRAAGRGPQHFRLACGNLAHAFAACGHENKAELAGGQKPGTATVSAYDDMLSARRPVADGRTSSTSGKVPAAIRLTPEAVDGG